VERFTFTVWYKIVKEFPAWMHILMIDMLTKEYAARLHRHDLSHGP
jgi:hypothetical protein